MKRLILILGSFLILSIDSQSQICDCPYPILLLHGYTGDSGTFVDTYTDSDFINVYGTRIDVFHAVVNATTSTNIWGADGIQGTADDDVLYSFNNLSNVLAPGCVYSMNFRNYWNEDPLNPHILIDDCSSPAFFDSDSNESAIVKQGYVLGRMIEAVLNANPDKDKVIVIGHSMGGLEAREYLQRNSNNWADPFATDGHKIKKLVTAVTPHGGSNTGQLIKEEEEDHPMTKDGTIDVNSESVRDLRYNHNCGLFSNCSSPYLYGGDEDDVPTFLSFHNSDVDCNGFDDDDNIVGINAAGSPNAWDGTTYNPTLPLPFDIRYTYITSNWVFGGDGVVDIDRQWLYTGNNPTPFDGVAHRMTDTLLTNFFHSNVDGDLNTIVRALDEGDYPFYAWDLNIDNPLNYAVVPHKRSTQAPDGTNSQDPDWFKFDIPGGFADSICISLTPNGTNGGTLEYFGTSSTDYTSLSTAGTMVKNFTGGGAVTEINLGPADYTSGTNYIRIVSNSVNGLQWKSPHKISITSKLVLPVEWLNFSATTVKSEVLLEWSTALEINNDHFIVYRSFDGVEYHEIGRTTGKGNTTDISRYSLTDHRPNTGVNFYKIRQIDYDGRYSETAIKKVLFEDPLSSIKIFPNPAKERITVDLQGYSIMQYELTDALGQLILKGKINTDSYQIDISHINRGHYHLQLYDTQYRALAVHNVVKL